MPACSIVTRHVFRGLAGLAAAIGACLSFDHPLYTLALLVVAGIAWRGCPACWTWGMVQAIKKQKSLKTPTQETPLQAK